VIEPIELEESFLNHRWPQREYGRVPSRYE
jgi:hypothetical protein